MGTYQLIDRTLETKVEGANHAIVGFQVQFFYRDIFTFFSSILFIYLRDFQLIKRQEILKLKLRNGWFN